MNNRRCSLTLKFVILLLLVRENHGNPSKNSSANCQFKIPDDLSKFEALILHPEAPEFVYPSENGMLSVQLKKSIRFACPGGNNTLNIGTSVSYKEASATCANRNLFRVKNSNVLLAAKAFRCKEYPSAKVKKTRVSCGALHPISGKSTAVKFEIGFSLRKQSVPLNLGDTDFLRVIDLCCDEAIGNTLWAHTKINATIKWSRTGYPGPKFRNDNFIKGIENAYKKKSQVETLKQLLGRTDLVKEEGTYYFARGHLIAKADMVYGSLQRATFYYINAVPMWQNVNNGNWKVMETTVRSLAVTTGLDFDVWVGGYGTLQLQHRNGTLLDIYLHVGKDGRSTVPVPKILFKVVYNAKTHSGIVFLTANNPYLNKLPDDYKICNDVCDQIIYKIWNTNTGAEGLSYCCAVEDFRKKFPHLPSFQTNKLLFAKKTRE